MSCHEHGNHPHVHGPGCGHPGLRLEGVVVYLHDGHLHVPHGDHVDEKVIAVGTTHPAACTHGHPCAGHDATHVHGPGCGHPAVPHGDHVDYVVDGHLHHPHGGHCDHHGQVELV
jgi:hypothetical protein